jgi:hypothetical protein
MQHQSKFDLDMATRQEQLNTCAAHLYSDEDYL